MKTTKHGRTDQSLSCICVNFVRLCPKHTLFVSISVYEIVTQSVHPEAHGKPFSICFCRAQETCEGFRALRREKMTKAIWDDDKDEEEDVLATLSMCPMGVTCAGGLFAFLFGFMAELLFNSTFLTLLFLSVAGAFGIAAGMAPGSDVLLLKRSDFLMMLAAVFILANTMTVFISVERLENIFLVAMSSTTGAGFLRPIMLVPYTLITGVSVKELLPSKNTC